MTKSYFLFNIMILLNMSSLSDGSIDLDCPVCMRVFKAIKDLAKADSVLPSKSMDRFCSLPTIDVEEQQLCYNIEPFKRDIIRILDVGADESRLCKKIKSVNSNFCSLASTKREQRVHQHDKYVRGIIYE
mmetsp:Transcript_24530/g.24771  ORF Transcript_24530/g.24771 Transcript_24530/m.24771 type:complete len:130 (-) Transcript_24530:64-453(-)